MLYNEKYGEGGNHPSFGRRGTKIPRKTRRKVDLRGICINSKFQFILIMQNKLEILKNT